MTNYFTLMSYILTYAPKGPTDDTERVWMRAMGEVMEDIAPIHTQILSTLTLLSNSLLSGQSLPPYLPLPEPYEMTRHLLRLPHEHAKAAAAARRSSVASSSSSGSDSSSSSSENEDAGDTMHGQQEQQAIDSNSNANVEVEDLDAYSLLDARNMEQQGYTEFAVIQVCSMLIVGELAGLIKTMGQLVGTVDFSFRVEKKDRTSRNSTATATTTTTTTTSSSSSTSEGGAREEVQIQRVRTYASRATGTRTGTGLGGNVDRRRTLG